MKTSMRADLSGKSMRIVAIHGVFWSVVQNWGGRLFTFILFVLLARFLAPIDYGIASAAQIALNLITIVAGFGFGSAVVQRPSLESQDVNLPFYFSMGAAALLSAFAALYSDRLQGALGVEGFSSVLVAICALAPLTTASVFQEMYYRRQMAFKQLALRMFVANLVAAPIAIALALSHAGVWSLVAQNYAAVVVGTVWLWHKPQWWPSLDLRPKAFWSLGRFGASVAGMALADFASTRLVEVMIIQRYGVAAYGLYAVGSRLYVILMQLLQSALSDVALSVLSRVADDRKRMGEIYVRAITISVCLATPVFVATAALASEICDVLFSRKWTGVDSVAQPLLLLGAVQCVQYLNGPYLQARGRPWLNFSIAGVKYIFMICCMLWIPTANSVELVHVFVLAQLIEAPIMFHAVTKELQLSTVSVLSSIMPAAIASGLGFVSVLFLRPYVLLLGMSQLWNGTLLGIGFVSCYFPVLFMLGRKQILLIGGFFLNARRPQL